MSPKAFVIFSICSNARIILTIFTMMWSQISQLIGIIASLACHCCDLIFTMCSVNYGLSNDLKVEWTRIAKSYHLIAWLISPSLFAV